MFWSWTYKYSTWNSPRPTICTIIKPLWKGIPVWFNEEEIALVNEKNAQFRAVSVEEEALTTFFETCNEEEASVFMQTTQIQQVLVQKTGFRSLSIQTLGHVLRDMKFERTKRNGVYGYFLKEKQSE